MKRGIIISLVGGFAVGHGIRQHVKPKMRDIKTSTCLIDNFCYNQFYRGYELETLIADYEWNGHGEYKNVEVMEITPAQQFYRYFVQPEDVPGYHRCSVKPIYFETDFTLTHTFVYNKPTIVANLVYLE